MHDPMVVVFEVRSPIPHRSRVFNKGERWRFKPPFVTVAGRGFRFPTLVTVWHVEPGGRDSGTVCKGMRGSSLSWANVVFAARHAGHLHLQVRPWQRLRGWLFDRCGDCGRRFFWRDSRNGYQSSDAVYHDRCMSLCRTRGQLEDAAKALTFTASDTERWRVERWLEWRETQEAAADG